MAKDITILGASYSDVPAVVLPKTGGGTARFDDVTVTTATAEDVAQGKVFVASDGTITAGTSSGGGGSQGWQRPAEWSNFDLLSDDDYAVYLTYDNRNPPTSVKLYASGGACNLQRVRINSDGSVDVLDSTPFVSSIAKITIPADAGDYPCYRVKAEEGVNITWFGLEDGDFRWQKILERWFNLPYCTNFNIGYSYRDWFNHNVVAETFVNFPVNNKAVGLGEYSLQSLRNKSDHAFHVYSRGTAYSLRWEEGEFVYDATTLGSRYTNNLLIEKIDLSNSVATKITSLASAFDACTSAKEIILPNTNYSELTTMSTMCRNCRSLERFTFPSGDYSAVTNTNSIFQDCHNLHEPIILPKSLSCAIGTSAFSTCLHLPCVVLLSETMMALSNVNAFTNIYTQDRRFTVYVRQALIEDYQLATNWATIYATNENFFQPIEGSEFEYLLEDEAND
ncbi:MAG: hypothetical protein E7185_09745 [Erysipelotrichaceae bacterium]|nr:hypothetical protein [Erysipelotrichaceae bacterium]